MSNFREPTSKDRYQYQNFCAYCLYPPSFDEWFEQIVEQEKEQLIDKLGE